MWSVSYTYELEVNGRVMSAGTFADAGAVVDDAVFRANRLGPKLNVNRDSVIALIDQGFKQLDLRSNVSPSITIRITR